MEEIKDALLRIVHSALVAKELADAYVKIGLDDNKPHRIYGDLLDAIYSLIGEHVDEFHMSITYIAMTAPFFSDERRVKILLSEYEKNHPNQAKQPKPRTFTQEEMQRLTTMNGGYMTPEGDWQ